MAPADCLQQGKRTTCGQVAQVVIGIDGLEWSIFKTAGTDELNTPQKGAHTALADVQEKTALLPDYGFQSKKAEPPAETPQSEKAVDSGKTVSGLVGGALTLLFAGLFGFVLKRRKKN